MSEKFNHRKKPRKEECRCGGRMFQNRSGNWFCEFELEEYSIKEYKEKGK